MNRLSTPLALAASLSVVAAACVLFVPSGEGLGTACTTAGAGTACGACIARACQSPVNACCGDSTCASQDMASVDSCATGQGCRALLSAKGAAAAAIATCVRASCADACSSPADGGPSPDLVTACVKFGSDVCRCTSASPFADSGAADADAGSVATTSCDQGSFATASACCAFGGWADGGAGSCVCEAVRCLELKSNLKSCVCGLYAKGADFIDTPSCSLGQPCCEKGGGCSCNERACATGETEVPFCDAERTAKQVGCENGSRVSGCL